MTYQIQRKSTSFAATAVLLLLFGQYGHAARPHQQPARPAKAASLTSFLPPGRLDGFVITQFDIRTINSSMNQGRDFYQARLIEVGYRPELHRRASATLAATDRRWNHHA